MVGWGIGGRASLPRPPEKLFTFLLFIFCFCCLFFGVLAPQASPGLPRPHQASPSLVRSGATVVFAHRERLERPLARAPPCFSHHENAWSARPLGRHRGFRTLGATGLRARSGATVFFTHRVRLERRPRLGPENLICKT